MKRPRLEGWAIVVLLGLAGCGEDRLVAPTLEYFEGWFELDLATGGPGPDCVSRVAEVGVVARESGSSVGLYDGGGPEVFRFEYVALDPERGSAAAAEMDLPSGSHQAEHLGLSGVYRGVGTTPVKLVAGKGQIQDGLLRAVSGDSACQMRWSLRARYGV